MKEKLKEQLQVAQGELNNANQQQQFWTHRVYALQGRIATLEELITDGEEGAESNSKTPSKESKKKD